MSKSDETGKGVIFLGDDPKVAAKKIMSAATDSVGAVNYDYQNQPGISNLLDIYALLSGKGLEATKEQFVGLTSYGELKKLVAEQVSFFLVEFQDRLASVDERTLMEKLTADEQAMNDNANTTLLKVQRAVGLRA